MRLTVVGCGDAFGAGGRLNTCFHVQSGGSRFLIDCGASSLIGLSALKLSANDLDAAFISHLHGDHFGGLPWLLIDFQYRSRRKRPFTIVGPKGIEARFVAATEALYPGTLKLPRDFELKFLEWREGKTLKLGEVSATPFEVFHPCGAPPYALRFGLEGKVLSFSGDTAWTDALIKAASGADLFICESYQYDQPNPVHLNLKTIEANFERLGAKRILLSHMGEEMLARLHQVDPARFTAAEDGMVLEL